MEHIIIKSIVNFHSQLYVTIYENISFIFGLVIYSIELLISKENVQNINIFVYWISDFRQFLIIYYSASS